MSNGVPWAKIGFEFKIDEVHNLRVGKDFSLFAAIQPSTRQNLFGVIANFCDRIDEFIHTRFAFEHDRVMEC